MRNKILIPAQTMSTLIDTPGEFTTAAERIGNLFERMNPTAHVRGSESHANGRFYLWYTTEACGKSCGDHEVTTLSPWTFAPPIAVPATCGMIPDHPGECAP